MRRRTGREGRQGVTNAEQSGRNGAIGTGRAAGRLGTVRAVLWLVVAILAVRQIAAAPDTPKDAALTDLTRFTGTPFGGLVLKPLTSAAEQFLGWGWTFGTLLLVVALGLIAARALPQPVTRRTALLAAPVAVTLLMLSLPVRNTLYLGQTSVLPVLLVLVGCFLVRGERAGGVCVGLAAVFQPTVLLFVPLLWFTGRRRAAASTGITFAGATALAWAAMPHDSFTYWVH
ncbi:glycosyltransferase family 87 protein, partial [Streptomyces scabiei]|uniref:glycosyltransferase family 87 protein n=1 Tax=Streptomyces scabiei TaxID=1930 RepID=UPI0036EAF511